jgi:phosphoglycolate phosphatase-like HAD superfamily hydrolase
VRLVLWDIDGTLVDTADHGRDAFGEAFTAVFGTTADVDAIRMSGRTDHWITMQLIEGSGFGNGERHLPRMFEELAAALEGRRELIAAEGAALPGVHAALEALEARPGVTQSLLTGNIEPNAAVKLSAFGLERHLDLEIGGYGSDHGVRPELVGIAREKARRLRGIDVSAADTVLIGDTPLDVDAAHRNGARAVAVATGHYDAAALRQTGADAVLEDLGDTEAVLAAILG